MPETGEDHLIPTAKDPGQDFCVSLDEGTPSAQLIRSKGDAPPQYPKWDDEDWDEDEYWDPEEDD